MRIVKTGDPCPLCGRPVTAEDRETLVLRLDYSYSHDV